MHLIKLNVQDSSFDKVITFLKELPESEIEIIEDKKIHTGNKKNNFKAVSLKTKNFKFNRDEANAR